MIRARTTSAAETQQLAANIAEVLRPQDLLLLSGDLGAGKTTFAKGLGKALGVTEPITSPTFVLIRSYEADLPLHHADIYRIEHLQEVIDLGLMELLDEGGVALVEWGELAAPVFPRDYLEIRFQLGDDDESRDFRIRGVGSSWALREKLVAECIGSWTVDGSDDGEGER